MIGPDDERPREDAARDSLTIELCDLGRGVCALVREVRAGNATGPARLVIACRDREPVAVLEDAAGVRIETTEPLVSWTCHVEGGAVSLDAELEAVSSPVELGEEISGAAGVRRYEQLCRVRGEMRVDGRPVQIDGVGRRAHSWGEPAAGRLRSLYAVGEDRAITVTAVRPRDVAEHGAELISAYLFRPESEPEEFEQARLSTVYDAGGHPRSAGLELYSRGDEYPRRVSGEAVCRGFAERNGVEAACFRWSFDGDAAQGGYELVGAG